MLQPIGHGGSRSLVPIELTTAKESRRMELQHVNFKLMLAHPAEIDLEPLIPIFHSWIQEQTPGELLLDIADYRHVHAGPGVILIGHEGNYSVDNSENRLGVRYNRKAELDGDNQSRLAQAAVAALTACRRLEDDPRLDGRFRFNGKALEVFVNDRLLAPNLESTREAVDPELRRFLDKLFRGQEYFLSFDKDPRKLLAVYVETAQPFAAADLLANLGF